MRPGHKRPLELILADMDTGEALEVISMAYQRIEYLERLELVKMMGISDN